MALRTVSATLSAIASVVTIVLALLAGSFRDWLYPGPLLALLLAMLGASLVYIFVGARRPSEADQRRAGKIFGVVPRAYMRTLDRHDFGLAWPQGLLEPVRRLHTEANELENHFESPAMEKARAVLVEKADQLDLEHTKHAFATDSLKEHRYNVGWSSGYLEFAPAEERRIADQRQRALLTAADAFERAHAAFVSVAHRRRFNLEALEAEAPPWTWDASLLPGQREQSAPKAVNAPKPSSPPGVTDDLLHKEF